ncbi:MAG: NUDIX domain-containing protein [Candidatus Heimdallarchaeota archaeon]|nr:NUDIX domain-containing protein [Candidatus Heimdallarchaeota archaeon]MCK4876149.1 NUDIX domain-containing protein [Candidatus Heimdallarchaeota archaeon]
MKKVYVGMAAIIEKDNKILVMKRSKEKDFEPNKWETVTGRLDADESPVDGILREVNEETKLKVDVQYPLDVGFFYRGGKEFPMVFISFYCKYLEGDVKITWEHSEYKWVSLEEAINLPDLSHFHVMFKNLKEMKKHLPNDFRFEYSSLPKV